MPSSDDLDMWTIYRSPRDFPGLYVARRWVIRSGVPDPIPTETVRASDSLEAIRQTLPEGLHCLVRSPGDDPVIVETWL